MFKRLDKTLERYKKLNELVADPDTQEMKIVRRKITKKQVVVEMPEGECYTISRKDVA
jgi:hypothetical protein